MMLDILSVVLIKECSNRGIEKGRKRKCMKSDGLEETAKFHIVRIYS